MAVKSIPDGCQTITPYLMVEDADALIAFLREVFGAEELYRMMRPGGGVWHAEVRVGGSRLMLSEATPAWPAQPGLFHVYVEDVDAAYARALAAGATSALAPADQFYGDRHAGVVDAAGNQWWIATHLEDLSPEELERRADEEIARRAVAV